MSAAIALREDYDAGLVRELAKRSDDADLVRRLLALAVVYDGGLRSDGAEAGGVGLQTSRSAPPTWQTSVDGLPQAVGAAAAPRAERCRSGGF